MKVVVLADEESKEEFKIKITGTDVEVKFVESLTQLETYSIDHDSIDAFFILQEGIDKDEMVNLGDKPVFINSAIYTLQELNLPKNVSRIIGWPTFLKRETWEIATGKKDALDIFEKLKWKYISVADEPGLVSARIICMIINEAYFALGENVSSKEEIDIAMKLGTNYPFGPFEWSKKIGLQKVFDLLDKLSETDIRYSISPAMKNELTEQ